MKWIKASDIFPDDPNEKCFRRRNGAIYEYIQTEDFEPEHLVYKNEEILYSKLEWLDETPASPSVREALEITDLQEQVRKHIREHNLFNWDEALSGEEMICLENLLLTFMPIVHYDSVGGAALREAWAAARTALAGEGEEQGDKLNEEEQDLIDTWRAARKAVKNSKFSIAYERLQYCKDLLGTSTDY